MRIIEDGQGAGVGGERAPVRVDGAVHHDLSGKEVDVKWVARLEEQVCSTIRAGPAVPAKGRHGRTAGTGAEHGVTVSRVPRAQRVEGGALRGGISPRAVRPTLINKLPPRATTSTK